MTGPNAEAVLDSTICPEGSSEQRVRDKGTRETRDKGTRRDRGNKERIDGDSQVSLPSLV